MADEEILKKLNSIEALLGRLVQLLREDIESEDLETREERESNP